VTATAEERDAGPGVSESPAGRARVTLGKSCLDVTWQSGRSPGPVGQDATMFPAPAGGACASVVSAEMRVRCHWPASPGSSASPGDRVAGPRAGSRPRRGCSRHSVRGGTRTGPLATRPRVPVHSVSGDGQPLRAAAELERWHPGHGGRSMRTRGRAAVRVEEAVARSGPAGVGELAREPVTSDREQPRRDSATGPAGFAREPRMSERHTADTAAPLRGRR
jgi:hypothetical protein